MTDTLDDESSAEQPAAPQVDPRETLALWANGQDEWVRYIVRQVLSTGRPLTDGNVDAAHALFRQEKGLDDRSLPAEAPLALESREEDSELPLAITKLSEVTGVNAIVPGSVIEPHEGMTVLFGENGTGKTGYSRVFKAVAGSRTADVVLGDISAASVEPQSARIEYTLGGEEHGFAWTGEQGQPPFTRMSIFDSPSVNFHVDDDLEYVYVPSVLALYNHVISATQAVKALIDRTISDLGTGATALLSRFPRESTIYPLIETLGATTDLAELRDRSDGAGDVDGRIEVLRRSVGALEANTLPAQISERQRHKAALQQAKTASGAMATLDVSSLNGAITRRTELREDYSRFRMSLFEAADLPAPPDETWEAFVSSGDRYRQHLAGLDVHDAERCLYCRQSLVGPARELIAKYGDYLSDQISQDIAKVDSEILALSGPIVSLALGDVDALLKEYGERQDRPPFCEHLRSLETAARSSAEAIQGEAAVDGGLPAAATELLGQIAAALETVEAELTLLQEQATNRATALVEQRRDLAELTAAAELARSWTTIENQVARAKEADKLRLLGRPFPGISRAVTELAKAASDQLINESFDQLFAEECEALRAPSLKVEFVGRRGRAQRRKTLAGNHKPSKVLSEGEQKVLALADFLAEARLAGITAPIIFDDPVSSLDHRRINEVARRVANLAEHNQVIVFTHDIFFATTLLSLFEATKRCAYFQVTDDDGKGCVTRASGPRWDTLGALKANINKTIAAASAVEGEARAALVREGYDWIRSWCEVFAETELLKGVSQRYQPNIRMTVLAQIKADALPAATEVVTRIFEEACRYIPGHSQPLASLGVAPTLPGLEAHWKELQEAQQAYKNA
jgi:energy-coupling factor transporter ATP-binding protein EcfA2